MPKAGQTSLKCGTLWIKLTAYNHHESKYRQFATILWRFGERMTEYLDELIHLFRKARSGTPIKFQNEEVKNHLLTGLTVDALGEIKEYLDLSAADIV